MAPNDEFLYWPFVIDFSQIFFIDFVDRLMGHLCAKGICPSIDIIDFIASRSFGLFAQIWGSWASGSATNEN
jgi:hypothetical protein